MSSDPIDLEKAEQLTIDGVVAVRASRDVLTATGPDAAVYLQGQISQNAEALAVGNTAWTLLLQPQGKVEAWLRMHRLAEDRFLLDVDPGFGSVAKDRLERFKLRVDVEFELQTLAVVALRGPDSGEVAATLTAGTEGVIELDASFAAMVGVDLVALGEQVVDLGSIALGPPGLLDVLRVKHGIPAMGSELDDSTIPAAAGIVDRSVDFTKGCYVGQELVARIDSRGSNTPTKLHSLRFLGGTPEPGAELELEGSVVGNVTSVALSAITGPIGLGYLKRSVEVPATVTVAGHAGITAEAVALQAG